MVPRSGEQDDLSAVAAGLQVGVRRGGLRERDSCARPGASARRSASSAASSGSASGARSAGSWPVNRTPCSGALGSAIVMTRDASPASAIASPSSPAPAVSNTASTPAGAAARTRSVQPSPYRTAVTPSPVSRPRSPSPAVPMTLMPRATASCAAMVPTLPPAPRISSVWPALSPRCFSARNAASPTVTTAAAVSKDSAGGLGHRAVEQRVLAVAADGGDAEDLVAGRGGSRRRPRRQPRRPRPSRAGRGT